MAVPVSAVKRKNPTDLEAPYKWYAHAQAGGEVNFDSLCRMASRGRTVTQADISASLYALVEVMEDMLMDGKIVRLGNFGSFQLVVRSKGALAEKEFNVSLVKGVKLAFRPGTSLVELMGRLSYEHVPQKPPRKKEEETVSAELDV